MIQSKTLNLLIKSLVDSDFLLINYNRNKNNRAIDNLSKSKTASIASLDPLETIKTLKQFIRLLQYTKKQPASFLHVIVENKQYLELLQLFFKDYISKVPVEIKDNFPKTRLPETTTQLLLLLDVSTVAKEETFFKRLSDKNIFLINKVNSQVETNNYGTYKIYNNLADFKKIVFLLAIIDQVLKK